MNEQLTLLSLLKEYSVSATINDVLEGANAFIGSQGTIGIDEFFRSALKHGSRPKSTLTRLIWEFLAPRNSEYLNSLITPAIKLAKFSPASIVVSEDVLWAFKSAAYLRRRTGNPDGLLGIRHVLFALAIEKQTQPELDRMLRPFDIRARDLAQEITAYLQEAEPSESWDVWLDIFRENGLRLPNSNIDSDFASNFAPEPKVFEPVTNAPPSPTATNYVNPPWPISPTETSNIGPKLPPPPTQANKTESRPKTQSIAPLSDVPSSPPIPPPRPRQDTIQRVPIQPDDPANIDELGRRPFAEVIAQRIEELRSRDSQGAERTTFMIHIDGPWGSGKSSILNFLRSQLSSLPPNRKWIVVDFNAWRNQRVRPPWWALITQIYRDAVTQLDFRSSLRLRVRWYRWRIRADWLPPIIAIVLLPLAILVTTGAIRIPWPGAAAASSSAPASTNPLELAVKILTWVGGTWAIVSTFTQGLFLGSARAAQTYLELRNDPLHPIVGLFQNLINAIPLPVVVFIDDMDRCQSEYVVELLEGIQTLLRTAPLCYVVAADRKWICSSFEQRYKSFDGVVGEPGRPLGYLFLDKIFQISAAVPQIPPTRQKTYWENLLRTGNKVDPATLDEQQRKREAKASASVRPFSTKEDLDEAIAAAAHDPLEQEAMRVAAAKQITSPQAERETEHRLRKFAVLLEPNPRSMKRLVNAYGLHQATHFLEGRNVSPEALARWTIVEMRWPLLADYLAHRPERVVDIGAVNPSAVPETLKNLFTEEDVRRVISGDSQDEPLTAETIRQIIGDIQIAQNATAGM